MDFAEYKTIPEKELQELLSQKRHELQKKRFQAREQQLKQVHTLSMLKKIISQIQTEFSNRRQSGKPKNN